LLFIVWWFKGNQYLEHQFENFALALESELEIKLGDNLKSLEHGQLIMKVKEAIGKKNLKCLIIFDDVDVYNSIDAYIPFTHENNVQTIITTKNTDFSTNAIKVPPFSEQESLSHLDRFFPYESHEVKINWLFI